MCLCGEILCLDGIEVIVGEWVGLVSDGVVMGDDLVVELCMCVFVDFFDWF